MITRRVLKMNIFACESGHKSILANNTRKAQHFHACQIDGKIESWSYSILSARSRFSWRTQRDANGCSAIVDFGKKAIYCFYAHFCHFHSIAPAKACATFLNMLTDKCRLYNHCHTKTAGKPCANRPNGRSIWLLAITGSHQLLPVEYSQ